MKKKTLKQNRKNLLIFFVCAILIICSYNMDINKTYKTFLDKNKISECLNLYNVDNDIIEYIDKNINIEGSIDYLTNTADSECMCLNTPNTLYLIFCGTQFDLNDKQSLIKDLITDLKLGLTPITEFLGSNGIFTNADPKIKIHYKYIENMNNENLIGRIIEVVEKNLFKKIIICGHSMGNGLGIYTSLVLAEKFPENKFTFVSISAPRLGNYQLNKFIKKCSNINHLDMINNKEIIPLFPFMYPGYCHVAKQTYIIKSDGTFDMVSKYSSNILNSYSIRDHFTNSIVKNLYLCINNFNDQNDI